MNVCSLLWRHELESRFRTEQEERSRIDHHHDTIRTVHRLNGSADALGICAYGIVRIVHPGRDF